MLQDDGGICDDAIIFTLADDHYLVVHGAGACLEMLKQSAEGKEVSIAFDDDLHDISLQGPAAVGFLDAHTPIDLPALGYFHQAETTLFGRPVLISRTGYSGERGYEIFATAEHVVPLWEEILSAGESAGIVPCSFTCLDKIRVEAALLFYPYDMTEANTPWEVTMGWSVSRKKGDFRGKDAVFAREGQEKILMVGIVADHDDAVDADAALTLDGEKVGVVNSPGWSHRMQKSLALCHVAPHAAAEGTRLDVEGESGALLRDGLAHPPSTIRTRPAPTPERGAGQKSKRPAGPLGRAGREGWLGDQDSNLDLRSQSPLSYR